MSKIVSVGELLVDMIGNADKSLKENPGFSKRAGGAPANVAVAASRLGADVEIVATVGDDEFGEFLVDRIEDEDVGTERARKDASRKTTLAFVALDAEGRPHFSFYRGADEHISRDQLQIDLDDDILHIGSLPFTNTRTADHIFELLENTSATVSFDPNLREELTTPEYKEMLKEIIGHVDILTAAEDELEFFGGLERLRQEIDEILVTRGENGADLYTGEKKYHFDAHDVDVVDTTGAGDALTGAYLDARSKGLGKEDALERAVKAASISTTKKGAMEALPHSSELE